MSHYRNLGGGRRDANEPQISKRFTAHGWHAEQVSGNRQWDLNVYPPKPTMTGTNNQCLTLVCHVDVKGPKGKVEEAQAEKWTALHAKGIPVYVVRTEADVDALVAGTLEPWGPEVLWGRAKVATGPTSFTREPRKPSPHGTKQPKRRLSSRKGDAAKAREEGRTRLMDEQWDVPLPDGRRLRNKPRTGAKAGRPDYVEAYTPPRSEPNAWVPARGGPFTPPRSTPPDAAKPMGMGHAIRDQDPAWLKARVRSAPDAAKKAEVFAPPQSPMAHHPKCTCAECYGVVEDPDLELMP